MRLKLIHHYKGTALFQLEYERRYEVNVKNCKQIADIGLQKWDFKQDNAINLPITWKSGFPKHNLPFNNQLQLYKTKYNKQTNIKDNLNKTNDENKENEVLSTNQHGYKPGKNDHNQFQIFLENDKCNLVETKGKKIQENARK